MGLGDSAAIESLYQAAELRSQVLAQLTVQGFIIAIDKLFPHPI